MKTPYTMLCIVLLTVSFYNPGNLVLNADQNNPATLLPAGWREPKLLSIGSTIDSVEYDLIGDKDNNLHIVWQEGPTYTNGIYYRMYNHSDHSWSTDYLTESQGHSFYPVIRTDSNNSAYIVFKGLDQGGNIFESLLLWYWDVNSNSWLGPLEVGAATVAWTQHVVELDAVMDKDDNLHIVWSDNVDRSSGGDYDINYRTFFKNKTFSDIHVISDSSTGVSKNPMIGLNSTGDIQITWLDATDIFGSGYDWYMYYRSLNAKDMVHSDIQPLISSIEFPVESYDMIVDSDDDLQIVWDDNDDFLGAGSDFDVYRLIYTPSSNSTMYDLVSVDTDQASINPCITQIGDTIHVVFADSSNTLDESSDSDLLHVWNNEENGWSEPTLMNTIESPSNIPEMTSSINGSLHLIWQEQFNPIEEGTDIDIMYSMFNPITNTPKLLDLILDREDIGKISVSWNSTHYAQYFNVYRSKTPFDSIDGMQTIGNSTNWGYTDYIDENGEYYYGVTAISQLGESLPCNLLRINIIVEADTITITSTDQETITETYTQTDEIETTVTNTTEVTITDFNSDTQFTTSTMVDSTTITYSENKSEAGIQSLFIISTLGIITIVLLRKK